MSDQIHPKPADGKPLNLRVHYLPLPAWIARSLLRPGEAITFVRGPRGNPTWERYATHPALFFVAVVIGAGWCIVTRSLVDPESGMQFVALVAAGSLTLLSVFVLGIASGHFIRLIVTNYRIVILQGQEVCRSWAMDSLPKSLLRYTLPGPDGLRKTVDLDAIQSMLGPASEQIVDANSILMFGKQLDSIKKRQDGKR